MKGPWVLLVGLVFFAASCNGFKLGYRWADRLILFKIDQYFDLSEPQETWLKLRIAQKLRWHRSHELPRYIEFVTLIARETHGGLSKKELHEIFQQWAVLRESLLNELTGVSAEFLLTTNEAQRQRFREKLEEENRALLSQQKLPEQERRLQRKTWFEETLEDWVGPLNKPQQKRLDLYIEQIPLQDKPWLARRIAGQNQFFAQLPQSTPGSLQKQLTELWVKVYRPNQSKAGRLRTQTLNRTENLLLSLYNQMSEKQKETLQINLEELKSTLEELQQES